MRPPKPLGWGTRVRSLLLTGFLSEAVTIIEKERDRDLYRILTTAQKEKWRDLVGKPVHVQWPLELWNE